MVASAVSLVRRYRRATGALRQQLKWFGWSGGILAITFVCAPVLWTIAAPWADALWLVLFLGSALTVPIATCVAILRYRLYEIDVRIIQKTLIYSGLVASLAVVYLGGISVMGWLFRSVTGQSGAVAVTLSTLAVAAGVSTASHAYPAGG